MPHSPGAAGAPDVMIFLLDDAQPPPRAQRLQAAARSYAVACGRHFGAAAIRHGAQGKPYFAGQPGLHFSVSHSGAYWAVAFADQPVGLDIQEIRRQDYAGIARRWFHPAEQEYLRRQEGAEAFFALWSAKESYSKLLGTGINDDFAAFSVVDQGRLSACCGGALLRRPLCLPGYSCCLAAYRVRRIILRQQLPPV